jgi:hypothetical protein
MPPARHGSEKANRIISRKGNKAWPAERNASKSLVMGLAQSETPTIEIVGYTDRVPGAANVDPPRHSDLDTEPTQISTNFDRDPEKIPTDGTHTDSAPPRYLALPSPEGNSLGLGRARDPWSLHRATGRGSGASKMGPVFRKGTGLFFLGSWAQTQRTERICWRPSEPYIHIIYWVNGG